MAATLGALLFAATAGAQSASGRVRIMHASPDAPAVDIFVDGQKAVTALAFPNNTGYVALPAGTHNVKVFPSPSDGSGTPVLEANLDVAAGKDYTVLAVGRLADSTLALLPLADDNTTPAAGKAHVRLIHASPDAPAVDVVVAGTSTKLFANVAFKGVGAYTPVNPGSYNLEVRTTAGDVVKSVSLTLAERTVYTAVAVGLAGNGSLQVVPLLDAAAPAAPHAPNTGTGLESSSSTSSLLLIAAAVAFLGAGSGLAFAARRMR
jgi:hypothetical protein